MDWDEELENVVKKISLENLSISMKNVLSNGLNSIKWRQTPENLDRDYRGLASLMNVDLGSVSSAEITRDPTEYLLNLWISRDSSATIGDLLTMLDKMTRYDVIDDLHPFLVKNLPIFKSSLSASSLSMTVVSRDSWNARSAREPRIRLLVPVRFVFLHCNGVYTQKDPSAAVRQMQLDSMEKRGSYDIDCNFIISPDGTVYEGTGWDYACGHSFRQNKISILIAYVGHYQTQEPDSRMIEATEKLIEYGIDMERISRYHGVYGMRHTNESESPGDKVLAAVSHWPSFCAQGDIFIRKVEQEAPDWT